MELKPVSPHASRGPQGKLLCSLTSKMGALGADPRQQHEGGLGRPEEEQDGDGQAWLLSRRGAGLRPGSPSAGSVQVTNSRGVQRAEPGAATSRDLKAVI